MKTGAFFGYIFHDSTEEASVTRLNDLTISPENEGHKTVFIRLQ